MAAQWQFIEDWARIRGVKPEAIRKWRARGVPGKFQLELVEDAGRLGINLTKFALSHAPKGAT